jgi:UrcA family protein
MSVDSTSKQGLTPHREITMKNLTARAVILAATTLAAYGSCTSAWADSNLEPHSITVRYEDLNANSPRGAAMLYTRIRIAAETVCGDLGSSRSLVLLSRYASCVHGAISAAVASVNSPAVTGYAAARGIVPADSQAKGRLARNN